MAETPESVAARVVEFCDEYDGEVYAFGDDRPMISSADLRLLAELVLGGAS